MRNSLGCGLAALTVVLLTGCGSPSHSAAAAAAGAPSVLENTMTSAIATAAPPSPTTSTTTTAPPTTTSRTTTARTTSSSVRPVAPQTAARRLPLDFSTGSATQVVTVVATNASDTTATLQMWNKADGGWVPFGASVTADIGRNGMTAHESEGAKAAPIGSFTLTQAFGKESDPGTALPYFQTTPDDWWISEPGPLYNTHQNCSSDCAFNTASGNPNEHLYYETPYYNYAVVIDYNTANAGGVVQGAGSAFFLHVTTGKPTLGCVAIPTSALLPLMRWLDPAAHPRILIGTA